MKKICYFFIFILLASPSFSQTWQKITQMPGAARDGSLIFSIGNKIYSGGGGDYASQKDFYEYDITAKKWTKKGNLPGSPTNRGFAAAFSIYGKGYVGLGENSASTLFQDLWEYDPASDKWTQKADYPGGGRDAIGVMVIGDKAYIAGGTDNANIYGDFYEYDPATDNWTQLTDLPLAIGFPSMFSIGNYGYMACGANKNDTNDLWRYDPANDSWKKMASFPGTKREAGCAFVLNGRGYVGLGHQNYTTIFNDIYSYDPVNNSWKKESNFNGGRAWSVSIAVGDTAYVGNGADFSGGNVNPLNDWWTLANSSASVSSSQETPHVHCYPQPAFSSIYLSGLAMNEKYSVSIFDALGRKNISEELNAEQRLDISALPKGVNTLLISDMHGKVFSLPCIKE